MKISEIIKAFVAFLGISCNAVFSQSLYEPAPGPFTDLTAKGKAKAQIILPANPTYLEEFAAGELQKYFKMISDVELPVSKENRPGKYSFSFFLGQTNKAFNSGIKTDEAMGRDGFEMKTIKKGLVIQGRNDLGTVFGVYELLERYFGVRWFMPGEDYITRDQNLKIGQVNLTYKPSFANRWVGRGEWPLQMRMNAYITAGGKAVGKWMQFIWTSGGET